jgi:serine protease Do
MDDKNKDLFSNNDIDRIQQEIEHSLYGGSQQAMPEQPVSTPPAGSADIIDSTARVVDSPASYRQPGYGPQPANNTFYHETIKNETNRYKKRRLHRNIAVIAVCCTIGTGAVGLGLGAGIPAVKNYFSAGINDQINGNDTNTAQAAAASAPVATPSSDVVIKSLSDVVKLVEPSVVTIDTVITSTDNSAYGGMFSLPSEEESEGTGIMFHQDSSHTYIVTNYHVIEGASSVTVSIQGSDPIKANFVGSDEGADIAVIEAANTDIKAAGITSVTLASFGSSGSVQVGDKVVAIGNAMGEGISATSGIVSAVNKDITVENRNLQVMQTDAAINPGNSGGPLVNTLGEVIGINAAKLSEDDAEGMGYSISSDVAMPIIEQIMDQTPTPWLGIKGADLPEEVAELYGLPQVGVYVGDVVPGSGAGKAGIQRTDIITSFNGVSIFSFAQLQQEVQKCKVGDTVEVKLYRNGKTPMTLQVTLTESEPTDSF